MTFWQGYRLACRCPTAWLKEGNSIVKCLLSISCTVAGTRTRDRPSIIITYWNLYSSGLSPAGLSLDQRQVSLLPRQGSGYALIRTLSSYFGCPRRAKTYPFIKWIWLRMFVKVSFFTGLAFSRASVRVRCWKSQGGSFLFSLEACLTGPSIF